MPVDKNWIRKCILENWGADKVVSRGRIYYPENLPGFIAVQNNKYLGLITYKIRKTSCEIITLNSFKERKGVGISLVNAVKREAKKARCKKIFLITTNDNIDALRFWQKRGFVLKNLYPNTIEFSRKLKPEIPLLGNYEIPIRDEIELELEL